MIRIGHQRRTSKLNTPQVACAGTWNMPSILILSVQSTVTAPTASVFTVSHGKLKVGGKLYACIGPLSVLPDTRDNCIVCTGAPFQWAALFHKDALRFVKGVDNLMFYYPPEKKEAHHLPCKVSCSICHTPMADEGRKMWMAFPTLFKTDNGKLPEAFRAS